MLWEESELVCYAITSLTNPTAALQTSRPKDHIGRDGQPTFDCDGITAGARGKFCAFSACGA